MSDETGLPLSDCVSGALHPVSSGSYYGHKAVIQSLEQSLCSGRFHHGWIFSGPLGVGKATLAYHLARVLLGHNNMGHNKVGENKDNQSEDGFSDGFDLLARSEELKTDKTGRLVSQFAHPDMRVMRRAYDVKTKKFFRFIRIDEMRALKDVLHTTPSMGLNRVVLIDRAEDMNEASGNALLKVLEEPPLNTTFILITNSLGQIPITIRSRCRQLKFNELELDDFEKAITQQFTAQNQELPKDVNWQDLMHLSGGSVRTGYELIVGNGLKYYQGLYKIMDGLPNLDQRNLDLFIDGILKDKSGQDYKAGVQLISDLIYRLIKGKITEYPLSSGEKHLSDKLVGGQSIDQWLGLWDTLQTRALDVEALNLDKKTFMLQSFFSLRDLLRAC
ncbi:DNA polymerase III subunit delta' [Hyphomicrobiales bacterium 4NK60-0047b]